MSVDEFCGEMVADLENKIVELGAENVACFIAKSIVGAGGWSCRGRAITHEGIKT